MGNCLMSVSSRIQLVTRRERTARFVALFNGNPTACVFHLAVFPLPTERQTFRRSSKRIDRNERAVCLFWLSIKRRSRGRGKQTTGFPPLLPSTSE